MKYFMFALLLIAGSCQKAVEVDACAKLADCSGECLFAVDETIATTRFLTCYNSWGVVYEQEDGMVGLIVDDIDTEFHSDSLQVKLCGYARTNQIPLEFPDPFFNEIYQFEAVMLVMD